MASCKKCGGKSLALGMCRKHYDEVHRKSYYELHRTEEGRKNNDRRKMQRDDLVKSLGNSCSSCSGYIDTSVKRSWFFVDGKVLCKNCWFVNKRISVFSRKYESCVNCGTTSKKHLGHGYCSSCFPKYRRDNSKK